MASAGTLGKHVLDFMSKSCDQFHAVAHVESLLRASGFVKLAENEAWSGLKRGGKFMTVRNSSSICAFVIGSNYETGNGIKLLSAHTDSPCLKLKPMPAATHKQSEGVLQIGVELYGGGIWHTWFDRDLALCGRVITKSSEVRGQLDEKLVRLDRALMNVPNLCIHLDRENHEKFAPSKEKHTVPIIATVEKHSLMQPAKSSDESSNKSHPLLLQLLSKELGVSVESIVTFDLSLYDYQKPSLGGAYDEFLFSARQDNLISCFVGTEALIQSLNTLESEDQIRMMFLFDNEEVGSLSFQGADSRYPESVIRRVTERLMTTEEQINKQELFEMNLANSFHVSLDASHYVHPNYSEKHEELLKPKMGKGPVLKINNNQKYASTSRGCAIIQTLADGSEGDVIPVQNVAVRNDSPCGTTVGPIIAAGLGIETVDMGIGLLSMHSIRETGCLEDIGHGLNLIRRFFASSLPKVK